MPPLTERPVLPILLAVIVAGIAGCKKPPEADATAAAPRMSSSDTDEGRADDDGIAAEEIEPAWKPADEPDVQKLSSDPEALAEQYNREGALHDIFFGFDRSDLDDTARRTLAMNAGWLRTHPQFSVMVEGHCDERGTDEYNLALGDRRASAARSYMLSLGIAEERIQTISYGEERPVDEGHNEAAWAKNRRGHFVVLPR